MTNTIRTTASWLVLVAPLALAACKASKNSALSGSSSASGGGEGGASQSGGMGGVDLSGSGGSGGAATCNPAPSDDFDGDGFRGNEGDCNDCDANVGPNAIEAPTKSGGVPVDEDCDGEIDEPVDDQACDAGLAIDELDPMQAAKTVELCKVSSAVDDWGLVSAKWVLADGSPPPAGFEATFHLGHGLLDDFGPYVDNRRGERMLALSSGTARRPTDPGYQDVGGFMKGYTGAHPVGFPKESPACPGVITGIPNDPTGIELVLRAPQNAHGIAFDFDFYTYEWPGFVCSTYNDFFVALLSPFPMNQTDGNISFDSQHNPVSVNNAFMEVCGCAGNPPANCMAGGKSFNCALGNLELLGTGFGPDTAFENHGATSWLETSSPIEPGTEIALRWAVYDSGDMVLDSTALIDNFRWLLEPGVPLKTNPIPR